MLKGNNSKMSKRFFRMGLLLFCISGSIVKVHAYIDPGTSGIVFSAILAYIVGGALFVFSFLFSPVRRFFKSIFQKILGKRHDKSDEK